MLTVVVRSCLSCGCALWLPACLPTNCSPTVLQAQGEWSQEEHELFMQTARQFGVGDKWGLFASYVPTRVGYQCSAYYRDVVVAQGLVIDHRFRMTRGGRAVFVG